MSRSFRTEEAGSRPFQIERASQLVALDPPLRHEPRLGMATRRNLSQASRHPRSIVARKDVSRTRMRGPESVDGRQLHKPSGCADIQCQPAWSFDNFPRRGIRPRRNEMTFIDMRVSSARLGGTVSKRPR